MGALKKLQKTYSSQNVHPGKDNIVYGKQAGGNCDGHFQIFGGGDLMKAKVHAM